MSSGITNLYVVRDYLPFTFFAARRSRDDFGFGPFAISPELSGIPDNSGYQNFRIIRKVVL